MKKTERRRCRSKDKENRKKRGRRTRGKAHREEEDKIVGW
jgi:hypothetical protein